MKDEFTTEALRKKFKNNFNLCNFAISIARGLLLSGQFMTLKEILKEVDRRATEE